MAKQMYVVNTNNKTITYRSEETDRLPEIYRLVDNDTAQAIFKGRITVDQVIEAVLKSEMSKVGFSYLEYAKKMDAALKVLNVSRVDKTPVEEGITKEEKKEIEGSAIKLQDILDIENEKAAKRAEDKAAKDAKKAGKKDAASDDRPEITLGI